MSASGPEQTKPPEPRTSAMVGKQKWAGTQQCSGDGGQPSSISTPATSALPPTTDILSPLSAFAGFTSGVDAKEDVVENLVVRRWRSDVQLPPTEVSHRMPDD